MPVSPVAGTAVPPNTGVFTPMPRYVCTLEGHPKPYHREIEADTPGDARAKYMSEMGITGTKHPIEVAAIGRRRRTRDEDTTEVEDAEQAS